MIRVAKPLTKIPSQWISLAKNESEKVRQHYRDPKTRATPYKFRAYSDKSVKRALDEIFHYKCAYCEFSYKGGYSSNVDHWRPKSAVTDGKGQKQFKPGYYWLAADWSNLFPACSFCNSINTHEFEMAARATAGKQELFPLTQPRRRGPKPGDERHEKPLLLNPSLDEPSMHLVFLTEGKERGCIAAKSNTARQISSRGQRSIEVYVLHRKQLVEQRRDHVTHLLTLLDELKQDSRQLLRAPSNQNHQHYFSRNMARLKSEWLALHKPYLGMTRQIVFPVIREFAREVTLRPFLNELNGFLPGKF